MGKENTEEIIGANRVAMANEFAEYGGCKETAGRIATGEETLADVEEYNALVGENREKE